MINLGVHEQLAPIFNPSGFSPEFVTSFGAFSNALFQIAAHKNQMLSWFGVNDKPEDEVPGSPSSPSTPNVSLLFDRLKRAPTVPERIRILRDLQVFFSIPIVVVCERRCFLIHCCCELLQIMQVLCGCYTSNIFELVLLNRN